MTNRMTFILLGTFLMMASASCQNKNQQTTSTEKSGAKQAKTEPLIQQVTQLDEFKLAQKQIDSLKKTSGIPVEISIQVIDSSFLKEDIGKNISLVYIAQQSPYDNQILYTVKFDKTNQKIISVDKNKRESAPADLPLPTDTIPKNN